MHAQFTELIAKGVDTGIKIKMDAPWMSFLKTTTGQILGTAVVLSILAMVIAAIVWVVSKAVGAGHGQNLGVAGIVVGIIACLFFGSVVSLVMYFTGFDLFA